jgi:uncharacterized protein YecT (DUF1311 family)
MMRNHRKIWLLFILLVAFPYAAKAQKATAQVTKPDPCEKATSQADMNDCYGNAYQKVDARLNHVYRNALSALQHDLENAGKGDPEQEKYLRTAVEDLKAAEVAWIKYRDLHCEAASQQYAGGTVLSMMHSICLSTVTEHRIDEIKQAYENNDRKLE